MSVTAYHYNPDTGKIVGEEFERETEHYLFRDNTRFSKIRGYGDDWYPSYEECRKATQARLQHNVKTAKEQVNAHRAALNEFNDKNPKQAKKKS